MFISILEQIISFLINAMESLMDEFSVSGWEPTLSIILPGLFYDLTSIVKIESVGFYDVQNVLNLMDDQAVQVIKDWIRF